MLSIGMLSALCIAHISLQFDASSIEYYGPIPGGSLD